MRRYAMPLTFAFIAPTLWAAEMHCPPALAIQSTTQAPAGWSAFDDADHSQHQFFFAEFSDGPPQARALLLHSKEADLPQGRLLTYDFDAAQQPWLICSYTTSSLTLSQRLPAAIRQCRVTLDKKTDFSTVKKIECF